MKLIRHTEAARLLGCNEKKLRLRNPATGAWLHYPELLREQAAPKCPIWMSEEQVLVAVEERLSRFRVQHTVLVSDAQRMAHRGFRKTAELLAAF